MNSFIQKIFCVCLLSLSLSSLYGLEQVAGYPQVTMKKDLLLAHTLFELQELRRELREVKEILAPEKKDPAPEKKDPVKTWKHTFWKVGYGVLLVSVPVSVGYLLYKIYSGDIAGIIVDQSYDSFGNTWADRFSQDHPTLHGIGTRAQSAWNRISGYCSKKGEPVTLIESQKN